MLFDGELYVHYGQFFVESRSDDGPYDIPDVLAGQVNGLCGAAVPGVLLLRTGLHTGKVQVTVELLAAPPPVGDEWEEVVEASFRPRRDTVRLVEWGDKSGRSLDLAQVDHRVRYCAAGMDEGFADDNGSDADRLVERYLLQLWPASPGPDFIIRQTSDKAMTSHGYARTQRRKATPKPAAKPTTAGGPPEWGAMASRGKVPWMTEVVTWLDREFMAALERSDENTRRAVAILATRRACAEAGLSELDWIAPALASLGDGSPLPAPLDDRRTAVRQLRRDPHVRLTAVESYDGRHELPQQQMALMALCSAVAADPRESLFFAVVTFGRDYRRLFAGLREALAESS